MNNLRFERDLTLVKVRLYQYESTLTSKTHRTDAIP
ncbi:Uncharacterised protein [Yersinia thracica]|uniref:Uncharacterized protein n=1 Tax=Yersinia thracica TaxID=2890319 RepID=A0A0T9P572_9GAMM|nr:Uncharacterised protein [Yersinia thracica]